METPKCCSAHSLTKQIINEAHEIEKIAPLVERDGKFLTLHDVWRDDYEREHGEKPLDAWG